MIPSILSPPRLEIPEERDTSAPPCHSPRPCPELDFPTQYMNAVRASLDGNYSISESILGKGISGTVKTAYHKEFDKRVAIKTIQKDALNATQLVRIQREYGLMKHVSHPNLIRLIDVIENPEEINIVMEMAEGGDLYGFIIDRGRPLSEIHAGKLFIQIADALCHLHRIGFVHRDIKPENILLDESHQIPYLADFGYSAPYSEEVTTTARCGSMFYAAPELLARKEYTGPEVDIWSLGVLLYVMLLGRLPFHGATEEDTLALIALGEFDTSHLTGLQAHLVRSMVNVDSTMRIDIQGVLEHPWLLMCAEQLGWCEFDEEACDDHEEPSAPSHHEVVADAARKEVNTPPNTTCTT